MPALEILSTFFVLGVEQTLQWKYGGAGILGLVLLSIGIRAKSPTLSAIGAVALALLVTRPAL